MSQTSINIRIDNELKKQFEAFCSDVGMSMTTAFCIFAKTVVKQQKIPFEISNDPFYSAENMQRLRTAIAQTESGQVVTKTLDELLPNELLAGE